MEAKRYAVTNDGYEFHLPRFEHWEDADEYRVQQAAGTVEFAHQGTSPYRIWDYSTTPPTDVTFTSPDNEPSWWHWNGEEWAEADYRTGLRASKNTCSVWGLPGDRDEKRDAILVAMRAADRVKATP